MSKNKKTTSLGDIKNNKLQNTDNQNENLEVKKDEISQNEIEDKNQESTCVEETLVEVFPENNSDTESMESTDIAQEEKAEQSEKCEAIEDCVCQEENSAQNAEAENLENANSKSEVEAEESKTEESNTEDKNIEGELLETETEPKDNANTEIEKDTKPIKKEKYESFKLENNKEKYAKTKELSKISKKNMIIVIAVLAVLLVTGITLSIALPIYFHYKDMIMVDSIEDFDKPDKGKYFVLKKDVVINGDLDLAIRKNYSINLNSHSLTVTGTMTYATDATQKIQVGTIKKKAYVIGGNLNAQKIIVNTPNSNVEFLTSIQTDNIDVLSKSITLTNASVRNDINIVAQTANLKGKISTDSQGKVLVTNCSYLNVTSKIESSLVVKNSALTAIIGSQIKTVILDDVSNAKISGIIDGFVEGGDTVAMLSGHQCKEYRNINTLALFTASATEYTTINCVKTVHIEQLQTPADFIVEERSGGQIVAVIGKVLNAQQYSFKVDGKEPVIVSSNEFDITNIMSNGGAGKHSISANAVGNYNFDELKTLADGVTVYTDSVGLNYNYSYTITLTTPEGLNIANEDGKLILSFQKVAFASKYNVIINNKVISLIGTNESIQKLDITSYITTVGAFKIRVSAHSDIAEINASKEALIIYNNMQQLSQVENVNAVVNDGKLQITWDKVANGKSYAVYVEDENGKIIKIATTTLNSYTVDHLSSYKKVFVKAEAYGFYMEVGAMNGVDIIIVN